MNSRTSFLIGPGRSACQPGQEAGAGLRQPDLRFDPEDLLARYVDIDEPPPIETIHSELALQIEVRLAAELHTTRRLREALQLALILLLFEIVTCFISIPVSSGSEVAAVPFRALPVSQRTEHEDGNQEDAMATTGNALTTSASRNGGDERITPDPRRWWALALLCGAFFMVVLDATIVLVALPSIQADLGFSEQGLQWVLSAYALTYGGLLLLGGRAADLLGRRRLFMTGVLLFTAASLVCGLAWSPAALLAARVVQGIGAAIMTPTALSIIATTFTDGSERTKALGIWGALGGIGATTAWLIGGPLVDGPGWE
jgi:cyanate permease